MLDGTTEMYSGGRQLTPEVMASPTEEPRDVSGEGPTVLLILGFTKPDA